MIVCVLALPGCTFVHRRAANRESAENAIQSIDVHHTFGVMQQDPFDRRFRGARGFGRSSRVPDRGEYPDWEIKREFREDVFTFVRIRYDAPSTVIDGRLNNDYPDSDWNFSFRLQQLTSFNVDPDGRVLRLNDPALLDYPFAYMLGVRGVRFSQAEIEGLRKFLNRGGFLMIDDFWTPGEYREIRQQMKRVFPDREPTELGIDHPIFNMVYRMEKIPQVPSIQAWRRGWDFEYWHGETEGDEEPHFHAINDDNQRVMVLMCLNNDVGDGWEREGENTQYFHDYSERYSYPLGINIVTYVMTH